MTQMVSFVSPAYREAVELLSESHTYISYRQTVDETRLSSKQRLQISYETMRLTARLTQIMAWLMMQRVAQNGDIKASDMEFEPTIQVGGNLLELNNPGPESYGLPLGLRNLLDRSFLLYSRVRRLDEQTQTFVAERESA